MRVPRHARDCDKDDTRPDGLNLILFFVLALLGWLIVALGIAAIYKGAGYLLG